jgi:hypothetical protein
MMMMMMMMMRGWMRVRALPTFSKNKLFEGVRRGFGRDKSYCIRFRMADI